MSLDELDSGAWWATDPRQRPAGRVGVVRPREAISDPDGFGLPAPERPASAVRSPRRAAPAGPPRRRAPASPADGLRLRFTAGRETRLAYAAAGLAVALWAVSLAGFDLSAMSGFGLLDAAPLTWFVAAGVAAVPYVVLAARGRVADPPLWLLHGALVLVLYGTTSVLYPEPRYAWMYKHLGVIEYLQQHGHLDRSVDIYHNWPAFFVLAAELSVVLHVDPITLARCAEPFFGIVTAWALHYAAGGLTRDRRLRWTTVALFTLTNWIGQGYLAPQAMALVLSLVFFGGVLRLMTRVGRNGEQGLRSLAAGLVARVRLRTQAPVADPDAAGVVALAVPLVAFVILVMTHQLTPVAVLIQLIALAVVAKMRPWWMFVVPVAVEGLWIALAWPYLQEHTRILSFDLSQNVQIPGAALHASLPGMQVAQWSGPAMMLCVGLLAAAGVVAQWRRGYVNVSALVLAGSPVVILAMSSYGSEAVFRVYLYALPWLAFLAAQVLVPSAIGQQRQGTAGLWSLSQPLTRREARTSRSRLLPRQLVVASVLLPLCLVASFFLERQNLVVREDVATATWFEEHSPPNAYLAMVAPSYPTRLTAEYPEHIIEDGAFAPAVTSWMEPTGRAEDALAGAKKAFRFYSWRPGYIVFTPSQRNFASMWGLLSEAEYDRFRALVATSPDFRVVHTDGGALVATFVGRR